MAGEVRMRSSVIRSFPQNIFAGRKEGNRALKIMKINRKEAY